MRRLIYYVITLSLLFNASCINEKNQKRRFQLLDSNRSGIYFNNEILISDDFNVVDFDYIYNGGGVAVGDFNNDGLPDIFFTGNMVSSQLYLNKGDLRFEEVTKTAGVGTSSWGEGVTLVDIDNNGLLDIYISVSNRDKKNPDANLLFVNQGLDNDGIPVFREMAAEYGINDRGYNTQAAFFDYDGDGFLDLYVLSNALESFQRNLSRPKEITGKGKSNDKLYRNNGNGSFSDVTEEAGILIEGYGLGIAISDINMDGLPDIYVANDFISNDIFYVNNGDGTFSNKIDKMLNHQSFNAMGVDIADYNNDGLADIAVLDMLPPDNLRQKTMFAPTENYDLYQANLDRGYEPQYVRNTLQLNRGNDTFSEIGYLAGMYQTDWSWAPLFADFDNDGWKDLFISNGYGKDVTDMDYVSFTQNLGPFSSPEDRRKLQLEGLTVLNEVKLPNYVYQNKGDLTFSDKSSDWGIVQPSISNGVAYADFDNDGDLDLVINNLNEVAFIYKNTTRENNPDNSNFLQISLSGPSNNPQGIGAKIFLTCVQESEICEQYFENFPTKGYKSFMGSPIHFGLGNVKEIREVEVIWPDGKHQVITDVASNQTISFSYQKAVLEQASADEKGKPDFVEVSELLGIDHPADHLVFKDFNRQRLLPHKHSENGPGIAVGDINGDGLDDFFVGGSKGNPGIFFTQDSLGKFTKNQLGTDYPYDDMGCLFLDMDNDGDLDLYVVSGGSRYEEGSPFYQDRIYVNQGNGDFFEKNGLLPELKFSGSVVTAADYDGDGFLDLFVGDRLRPGNYPLPGCSAILRNVGGKLIDVTEQVCPELKDIGMVTTALWTDFDGDGKVDLMLAGEWMPIKFFRQKQIGNKVVFEDVSGVYAPDQTYGWWNSIYAADIDGDGNLEYLLGNLGLNARWKASSETPLSMTAKDFDGNNSIDPIMFQFLQDGFYPVMGRDAIVSQVPSWKQKFLYYSDYAKIRKEEFFSNVDLEKALFLDANVFESSYLKKSENGGYLLKRFPMEVQFAPVFGIQYFDSTVLMIGNFYGNETITGRYDAHKGLHITLEKDRMHVNSLNNSGFIVNGQGRALAQMYSNEGQRLILAAQHQDSLKVFKKNEPSPRMKTIGLGSLDFKILITFKNGHKFEQEVHYGNGYLSQSSRKIQLLPIYSKIEAIDYKGVRRVIWEE